MLGAYRTELAAAVAGLGQSGARVESIFFGGGTPSLMRPATVAGILDAIAARLSLAPDCEITLEANPSSVEAARFRGYRDAGVNRVSLGVQALDDAALKRLGRLHDVAQALAAVDVARSTFERVSFDLIYARPGQTSSAWEAELGRALGLCAGHLSLYQLTIEDGTPFEVLHRAGKLVVPEPEVADALYALTQDMTEAAGLPAYEISNHARPGQESRHNLVYWRYGQYIGLGPGAHGREERSESSQSVGHARIATVNERNPEAWLAKVEACGRGTVEEIELTRDEQADELLLMGLRLAEGVDLARLEALTRVGPRADAIARLVSLGMLEQPAPTRLRATRRGRFVLNEIVRQLSASLIPAPRIGLAPP
jgi:oxygen-independent coproporphyrinogen-3 oxidase